MMTAIANSTKEVVVAKGASGRDEFSCPDCKKTVYPRHRAKWTDHFVHKPNSTCKTKLVASLESDEHKLGKQLIIEWLKPRIEQGTEIVTEKTIKTLDGRLRKIDVAVINDGKLIEAHECQLSPICIDTESNGLLDRTLDYYQLGIPVYWWLGSGANTETVRKFLVDLAKKEDKDKWGLTDLRRDCDLVLTGIYIGHSSATLDKIIEHKKEMTLKNKKKNAFNAVEVEFISLGIAQFLNSIRQNLSLSNQKNLDNLIINKFEVLDIKRFTKEEIQIYFLSIVAKEYVFHLFPRVNFSDDDDSDKWFDLYFLDFLYENELTSNVVKDLQELAQEASFELVVKNALSCFENFADYYTSEELEALEDAIAQAKQRWTEEVA